MLVLTTDQYETLVRHARDAYPNEACALLGGDGHVERVYPVPNAQPSPSFFVMDSKAQKVAMDDIDDNDWQLLGIFHSHTFTEAYPSKTDIGRAVYADAAYLILSLADQEAPVLRAFEIKEGEVSELEVVIGPEGDGQS